MCRLRFDEPQPTEALESQSVCQDRVCLVELFQSLRPLDEPVSGPGMSCFHRKKSRVTKQPGVPACIEAGSRLREAATGCQL